MEPLGDDLMIQNPIVSQNNFTFVARSITFLMSLWLPRFDSLGHFLVSDRTFNVWNKNLFLQTFSNYKHLGHIYLGTSQKIGPFPTSICFFLLFSSNFHTMLLFNLILQPAFWQTRSLTQWTKFEHKFIPHSF